MRRDKAAIQCHSRDLGAHFGPTPFISSREVSAVTYPRQESFDLSQLRRSPALGCLELHPGTDCRVGGLVEDSWSESDSATMEGAQGLCRPCWSPSDPF